MPVYHFNVHDGADFPDQEGTEFPDIAAARVEAVQRIADILKAAAPSFWSGAPWHMAVSDDNGMTLFTIMFLATNAPLAMR